MKADRNICFLFYMKRGEKMAFIDLFIKREAREETKEVEVTDEQVVEENNPQDLLLKSLLKGEEITKQNALSVPAVSSAVDMLSSLVAPLPVKLYKKTKGEDGKTKIEEVENDIRLNLLNQDTGDLLDPFQLKKAIVYDYLVNKGAYVYIDKVKNDCRSLRYIEPDYVSPQTNFDPIFKDAKYLVNGKEYEVYNFLTILRNTKDGVKGVSAVDEISKSIETAFTTILYELGIVKKGGAKKGFLTATRKLGKDEIKLLKDAWNRYYGGNNEENVIVLNDGIEFKEGANSSVELQINDRKKTLKDDIKEVFHIFDDYNTTIKVGVMPIISAMEHAYNKNLLLESEKGLFYFAVDTKQIIRGNLKERFEAYKIASDTGWLTKNEIRNQEDYDSIEGLDVVSMNLANVLYDINSKKYYTPNTGSVMNMENGNNGGGDNDENPS